MPTEVVQILSDLHYPFSHRDSLDFLIAVREKYSPTRVVCTGDEVDHHALSDYDHDPDGDTAGVELKRALKDLRKLYTEFPEVQTCVSNHTARPFRRAYKYGIPRAYLRDYAEFLEAPEGWTWGEKFEIDDVVYEHGEGLTGKLGHLTGAEKNMQSTVIGHIHSHAGIAYLANPRFLIFGMNVGCLLDKDAYAMAYGIHLKSKPVLGCGIVDRGVPTFIPMLMRGNGRWVGKL